MQKANMLRRIAAVAWSLALGCATFALEDSDDSAWVFATDKLPMDESGKFLPRYMATIGNGHVATTVFTDNVYMNGFYNGNRGESHRARIPSRNNVRVKPPEGQSVSDQVFELNVEKGWFEERFNVGGYTVVHRLFAHRSYHTLIVNYVCVTPVDGGSGEDMELHMDYSFEAESEDVEFEEEVKYESIHEGTTVCGRTKDVEDPQYQAEPSEICLIWTTIPKTVKFSGPKTWTFFTAYGKSMSGAGADFDTVADLVEGGNADSVISSHVESWNQVWSSGRIQVKGNLYVQRVINSCFYYLISSLPITGFTNSALGEFFGLSPGGLANGGRQTDYQGHNFWDAEMWVFPSILYFFPDTALQMLNYRLFGVQAARDIARNTGYEGVRFPWESGFTGREVTPDCCPLNGKFQIHITADIAFAARQYISATRDLEWLTELLPGYGTTGLGLLKEIAQFWISRITFDPLAGQHEILHVMPPDDDHRDVDNCVYTNVVAAYAVFFAKYATCLADKAGKTSGDGIDVPEEWIRVAESLKLVHDPVLNYHPEYEGYPVGELIKQADVVLLGFPLMYPMSWEERKNDLLLYGNVTRPNGPAMTWAMHLIGFLELDDEAVAHEFFLRSFKPYVREPFYIWTEANPPTLGAINYMTGMGSFLQGIVTGYGGLRLHTENITFHKPRIPKNIESLEMYGLNYLGNNFNVLIDVTGITLESTLVSNKFPLIVEFSNGTTLDFSAKITLPPYPGTKEFWIKSTASKCPLPVDVIDRGYAGGGGVRRDHWSGPVTLIWFLLLCIAGYLWIELHTVEFFPFSY